VLARRQIGILCAVEARRGRSARSRRRGRVPPAVRRRARGPRVCDAVVHADARDPLAVKRRRAGARRARADLTLSCVNVDGVELAAILVTRPRGKVYFFAMSTSFTAPPSAPKASAATSTSSSANGYAEGHAAHTLELVRGHADLRALLARRYG